MHVFLDEITSVDDSVDFSSSFSMIFILDYLMFEGDDDVESWWGDMNIYFKEMKEN